MSEAARPQPEEPAAPSAADERGEAPVYHAPSYHQPTFGPPQPEQAGTGGDAGPGAEEEPSTDGEPVAEPLPPYQRTDGWSVGALQTGEGRAVRAPVAAYGPQLGYGPPPGYGPLPGYGGPPPGYGPAYAGPPPGRVPPRDVWRVPARVEPVPGTNFAIGYLAVPPHTSGLAIGSLVAGTASILISLLVTCFGHAGAGAGWGAWVAGAFAVLASLTGLAGLGIGLAAMRLIRRSDPAARPRGRGLAIAGVSCGGAGLAITVLAFASALLLQFG